MNARRAKAVLLGLAIAVPLGTAATTHPARHPAPGPVAAPRARWVAVPSDHTREDDWRSLRASRSRPVPSPSPSLRHRIPENDHQELGRHTIGSSVWDRLAFCEASGDWHEHGANGFYGGLQFTISTWKAYGGLEYAWRADYATREEQIIVAKKVLKGQGWGAWPACSRKLGLR